MQIKLANPRGFCAGVDRAIEIVNRALEVLGHRSMCVMKWCTTSSWSKTCATVARSSSKNWIKCRTTSS